MGFVKRVRLYSCPPMGTDQLTCVQSLVKVMQTVKPEWYAFKRFEFFPWRGEKNHSLPANLPEDGLAHSPLARWNNCDFYYTALKHQQLGLQPALLLKLLSQPQSNWVFLSKISNAVNGTPKQPAVKYGNGALRREQDICYSLRISLQ